MKCKSCGASFDPTAGGCPSCGADLELGRLTGILGVVCRDCDAYNEPGAKACAACGKPLGARGEPPAAPAPGPAAAPPPAPPPAGGPVVRAYQGPGAGAATRFIPAALRPTASKPPPDGPALTPVPLVPTCPRCGAETGAGRFCLRCGHALGVRGTQVIARPSAAGRPATQRFTPPAPGKARLVVEAGPAGSGASFPLEAERVEVGRAAGAVAFPDDPCLAAHHATFVRRGEAVHLRDEGAPGGVYLRLRGVSVPLRPGDAFAVGGRLLRYAGPLPPPSPPPADGTRPLGAPRPPAPAIVVEECLEGGAAGRVFVRTGPAVTIGRAGCALCLGDDPLLAPAHAELLVEPGGAVRLKDLGSASGTYVRLPPHAERELHDGDLVRVGRRILRVALA